MFNIGIGFEIFETGLVFLGTGFLTSFEIIRHLVFPNFTGIQCNENETCCGCGDSKSFMMSLFACF